ncbi:DUF881 domain-containing protein [Frankia sp. AiPs1]|uniref:DUF881 domain-containing protein n=1 Tax=Frankia sp. AiPa1 TaxID=573492 RepID=UPI00202B57BC|nr:DUF881 domain-containing protein [Frankia sp. AiPa1]MCL9761555.1 DUF881 domain-containing protein [Frankia sp. AiPa1]
MAAPDPDAHPEARCAPRIGPAVRAGSDAQAASRADPGPAPDVGPDALDPRDVDPRDEEATRQLVIARRRGRETPASPPPAVASREAASERAGALLAGTAAQNESEGARNAESAAGAGKAGGSEGAGNAEGTCGAEAEPADPGDDNAPADDSAPGDDSDAVDDSDAEVDGRAEADGHGGDGAGSERGKGGGTDGTRSPGAMRAAALLLLAAFGFGGVVAVRSASPSFSLGRASPDQLAATLSAIGAADRSLSAEEQRLRLNTGAETAAVPGAVGRPSGTGASGGAQATPGPGPGTSTTGSGTAAAGSGTGSGEAPGATGAGEGEGEGEGTADELAVLAGTVPVAGPGLELTVHDPHRSVDASVLVDALQELRDAGAEAIEIAGVRTGVSTYIADSPGHGLVVDGRSVTAPYVVRVVGDAHTLDRALRIPGGVLDTVAARDGAQAGVRAFGHLEIRTLRAAPSPRYARPAG